MTCTSSCSPLGVYIILFALFIVIGTLDARTTAQFKGAIFFSLIASFFTTLFMFFVEQLR